jgi:hypothetical protein
MKNKRMKSINVLNILYKEFQLLNIFSILNHIKNDLFLTIDTQNEKNKYCIKPTIMIILCVLL